MIEERLEDPTDEFHVWPAFVDLLAASSLLFVTLLVVFISVADLRERGLATQKNELLQRLSSVDTTVYAVIDDGQFVRVILKEEATFPQGEFVASRLEQRGKEALGRIGTILMSGDTPDMYRQIRVLGHADSIPYRDGRPDGFSNWELSAARAAVVARYLVNEVRVDPCKVSASGLGPYFPRPDTTGALPEEERRRRNRRIEIEIVPARAAGTDRVEECSPYGDGSRRPE